MPDYSNNSAMKSGLDAQVNFMTEVTRRTYDSARRLSELNLHFVQQMIEDSIAATHQILSCSDPMQMGATVAKAAQPAAQHVRSYQQQLVGVLTGVQVELTRTVETLLPESTRYAAAMAQSLAHDSVSGADVFTNASRANGSSADSSVLH